MGVYINGVEIPKAQFQKSSTLYHVEGTIFIYPDGKARAELSVDYKERKSYPLVPVPPHGDLIGRDDLLKEIHDAYEARDVEQNAIMDKVSMLAIAAPTIIPAEEGET